MTHEINHHALMHYLDHFVPTRPLEMQAMEKIADEINFPIIGPASGQFCYQVARMIQAQTVFEMGSGYGYSTAWFARAVKENGGGRVYHTVWDANLSRQAQQHLAVLGYGDIVKYQVGEAVQALRDSHGPFDLIFNDIDKEGYLASLPVIAEKLRPGGVLLVDNLLWHGDIFNGADTSVLTQAIRDFTKVIMTDPLWSASIIPIRDGILLGYKLA